MLEEAKASVEALVTEVMAVPTDTIYSSFEALVQNMQAVGIERKKEIEAKTFQVNLFAERDSGLKILLPGNLLRNKFLVMSTTLLFRRSDLINPCRELLWFRIPDYLCLMEGCVF